MPLKDPDARKAYDRKRHRQRRDQGLCINCTKVPVIAPQVACESCRAKQRKAHKTLSRQHEEAGLCNRCGQRPPIVGGKLCEDCNAQWRKLYSTHSGYKPARKVRRQTLKRTVMEAYGGARCACCGETEMAFLTIDHITGQGRHHRQVIDRRGETFYRWLKVHRFPSGYRVLCMNCNFSLGVFGYCPHQMEHSKDA
jgi:hypothetical protein